MSVRRLVGAISRFGLIVCAGFLGRSGFGLVREQGRDCSLEIVGPYRVSDVRRGVEVERYADVGHLLVGEQRQVRSFESDGFRIVWKE